MIGGGLGRAYPAWARREFIRRRRQGTGTQDADARRAFQEVRSRETFQRWAQEAGLARFTVLGEGGLDEDDDGAGVGIWLRFQRPDGAWRSTR